MTQEDKELLLKDLCARLPYKVIVHIIYNTKEPCYGELTLKDIQWFIDCKIQDIKPYLRPLSSMTEEERKEYERFSRCSIGFAPILMDWLYSHHLDWRGLIPIGLAIEAPKGMYEIQN